MSERKRRVLKCPRCKSTDLRVDQRLCNHSAFNGYRYTPSDYSALRCMGCQWPWRTKADVSHIATTEVET